LLKSHTIRNAEEVERLSQLNRRANVYKEYKEGVKVVLTKERDLREETIQVPVTRLMGMMAGVKQGLIFQPDQYAYRFQEQDKVVLCCSGRLFQYLKKQEFMSRVCELYQEQSLQQAISELEEWVRKRL
jgi:hypothetical protein